MKFGRDHAHLVRLFWGAEVRERIGPAAMALLVIGPACWSSRFC
jgi:hypothetical protein